jgi:hypothetical protein
MEEKIRQALNDPDVWLDTRFIETYRVASPGSPEICLDDPNSCRLQSLTREAVNSLTGLFAMGIQTRQEDEEWIVSAEVCGSRMLKPHEVQAVEDTLRRSMEKPVTLRAFSKVQSMVTSSGHIPGY